MISCTDRLEELGAELEALEANKETNFSILLQVQSRAKWYKQVRAIPNFKAETFFSQMPTMLIRKNYNKGRKGREIVRL